MRRTEYFPDLPHIHVIASGSRSRLPDGRISGAAHGAALSGRRQDEGNGQAVEDPLRDHDTVRYLYCI